MRATEFVESYFDAWNHRDPEGVADHLTADGIYCDIPENARTTHSELIETLSDFFSTDRHRYELVGEILTGRETIAYQYRILPDEDAGDLEYSSGAEFMTLHGDAAITITDYYDVRDRTRPANMPALPSGEAQKRKYAKSGLTSEQLLEYKRRLEHIMQSRKIFLSSDLTLPKLAEAVDCSVNHLSQVINSGCGMSFFDYLNQYRIEHARKLMTTLNGQSAAILNIAFTVGFNSNSAFYAAFKKYVGQTPAQYRRSQLPKPH